MKLTVHTDGMQGYKDRALARAARLDRNEKLTPEISITFDDPVSMAEVLTVQRLRLVRQVQEQSSSISDLARRLRRDPAAVRKDVNKLESVGMVRTEERINPGHGRVKFVLPAARELRLIAVLS
ncbi:MAG: MarR family transcriptional regulator [Acidobacteriota bacterium]|nr:MarR family transcriptional regulator [Acidobacteriota bacterium]